ncbi:ABC transporter permease [Xylophilus sp. ASV27]|uniref:ABC transporter permease n=1 Tax=Xylophilus sp. ASV27 TaxID=2795129 RepID=UPI0018ECF34A|nr:ABC transporter permease [Xylophilus sp. ASV27]
MTTSKTAAARSKLGGIVLMLAAWQLFAMLSDTRMFPGLDAIGLQLIALISSGELLDAAGSTLSKGALGLAIATGLGSAIGMACARNRVIDAALHPIISFLYPVPKLALYPVVILVFGLGASSKVVQVALECFFPLFVQMYAGARSVPKNMEWLAANNELSGPRFAEDVLLPTMLPFLLTGLRVATPIMLIVMCVTEFVGESRGLGALIVQYSSYFDTASAFAVVMFFGLLGLAADRLIVFARTRLVHWERGGQL